MSAAAEHLQSLGVVRERREMGLRLFSFDESWPHLGRLLALFDRVAEVSSQKKNKAIMVAASQPDLRREKIPPRTTARRRR
jgi:hypothetical protein